MKNSRWDDTINFININSIYYSTQNSVQETFDEEKDLLNVAKQPSQQQLFIS